MAFICRALGQFFLFYHQSFLIAYCYWFERRWLISSLFFVTLYKGHIGLFVRNKIFIFPEIWYTKFSIETYPQGILSDRVALRAEVVQDAFQTIGWYFRMISDLGLAYNLSGLDLAAGSYYIYPDHMMAVIIVLGIWLNNSPFFDSYNT